MKKIIIALLFSLLFCISYAQTMQVTIQFLTVYQADGNDSPILRVSVDNRGYNFPGQDHGGFQTGGGISDVSNDPNNYDTYIITRSQFTPIHIDYEGWNDKCHTVNSTYWDYQDNCKCQAGPINIKCHGKNDYNKHSSSTDIPFWEFSNNGASSRMYYTDNNQQGFTIRVTWTPMPPINITTNLTAPEACGNNTIILTANMSGILMPLLPVSVAQSLRYVWQEGVQSGSDFIYSTIATTSTNTYTYTAPSNAPLNGSLTRQFRVYTTLNNVYSQAGMLLNNPVNIFPPPPTGITSIIHPNSCNSMLEPDGNIVITGVTGGVGIYSYSISNSVETYNSNKTTFNVNLPMDAYNKPPSVQGLKSNDYSVIVYNYYNGVRRCSYTKKITITQPLPLAVSAVQKSDYNGFNVSCNGSTNGSATVTASGGNTPYTYLFDDEITFTNPTSNTTGSFPNLKAATYYTKITDAKNCPVNPVTVTMTEPSVLTTVPVKTDVLCKGNANGKIEMTTTGGAGAYTYSLNNAAFTATVPFTGLAPGTYSVIAKDRNNCTVTSVNTLITEPLLLTLSASGKQDILCNGASTGTVTLSAGGGITPYQYSYNGTTYQTSGNFNTVPAGTYSLNVKDRNNCITSVSAVFTQPPALQNTFFVENVSCFGREDGSVKANVSGGVSPYAYQWFGRQEITDSIGGLYDGNYTLSLHDANNCSLQQTAVVKAPPTALVIESVSTSNARCEGICDGSLTVSVSGGITPYTYYYNNVPSNSNVLESACGERYTLKVKDAYNCIITDHAAVPLTSSFGLDLPDSVTLCTGQSYILNVPSPNTMVAISSLNGFNSTTAVPLSVSDQYYLTLSNAQGCVKKDTMVLTTSSDLLKSRFIIPSISYAGDTVNFVDLSWPRPDSVSWVLSVPIDTIGNNEGFVRLSYQEAGRYTIKLTAYMGACRDSITKTITVEPAPDMAGSRSFSGLGFKSINELKLYPVPNTGRFIVEIHVSDSDDIYTSVLNMFGEIIHTEVLTGNSVYKTHYDFLSMSPGMYVLSVKTRDDAKIIKFLVE